MPEVNLLHNTEAPEDPLKKPVRPKPEFEVTNPDVDHGVGHFFKSFLGHPPKSPTPDTSRMGMAKSNSSQRILKETRGAKAALAPLPDDDNNLDVNLLTEDILNRQKPREKMMQLIMIGAGALALVGLVYGGLIVAKRSVTTQIAESRQELASVEAEIAGLGGKQQTVQQTVQKITAIRGLIDRHIRWTKFFSLVEKYTLPDVSYGTSFAGDIGGALTFSAQTDSYENLAKQYLVYEQAVARKELLSEFTITGASKSKTATGAEQVSFAVSMTILPSAFENTTSTVTESAGILPNLEQLASFSTYVAGLCYLKSQPADLSFVPSQVQTDFESAIASTTTETCAQFSSQDQEAARRLLVTDTDQDQLNALLELLIGTNDQIVDTDRDGQNDLSEFLTQANKTTV